MATSFGASVASVTENAHKSSTNSPVCHRCVPHGSRSNKVSFRLLAKPKLRFSSKSLQSSWNSSAILKTQSNEVASTPIKSETSPAKTKISKELPSPTLASEESLSEFITQVSELVKLVDSKDIMELQLKQLDCELTIRKKEALPPPSSAPVTYVHSQPQHALPPTAAPSPAPTPAPSPASTAAPAPPKAQPSKSSRPPLKSPMAGTFYRSPAPGEPAFVKAGDKVQKGQVLCIIEAMKLMNEIEADQSGTITEIIAEDAKPVSVDTPLFVIEP